MKPDSAGIGRLYGNSGLSLLRSARIAVVGIGGVGSWAAEALARSGVGTIILMDMDDLCITNTNRQIHALASTIGQSKTETMATRLREINPEAEVIPISNFYTASNAEKLLSAEPDVIIDAIDSLIPKAHLIGLLLPRQATAGNLRWRGRAHQSRPDRNRRPLPHQGGSPALQLTLQAEKRLCPSAWRKSPETENPLRFLPGNARISYLRRNNLLHT